MLVMKKVAGYRAFLILAVFGTLGHLPEAIRYDRDFATDGYRCTSDEISFITNTVSRLGCATDCDKDKECYSWFYAAYSGTCYGCRNIHKSNTALMVQNGTECYIAGCPPGWVSLHRACYLVNDVAVDFVSAWNFCEQQNSRLLYLETMTEINMVKEFLLTVTRGQGINGYWLALTDQVTEGEWRWYGSNDLVRDVSWADGEPDSNPPAENCVMLYHGNLYNWSDVLCEDDRFYAAICEKNPTIP